MNDLLMFCNISNPLTIKTASAVVKRTHSLFEKEEMLAKSMFQMVQDIEMSTMYKEASAERVKDFDINSYINQWKAVLYNKG